MAGRQFIFTLATLVSVCLFGHGGGAPAVAKMKVEVHEFSSIYEASAVVSLSDTSFLIFEDDGDSPIVYAEIASDAGGLALVEKKRLPLKTKIRDIEGAVIAGNDDSRSIFVITSHSDNSGGKKKAAREKLLLLTVLEGKITGEKVATNLRGPLENFLTDRLGLSSAEIKKLNIEGLSASADGQKLLLGLREPRSGKNSLIVILENPHDIFRSGKKPRFNQQVAQLDLGGGGVRAMGFDKTSGSYLLANEVKNKKGKLRPGLWKWDGVFAHSPERIQLAKLKGVKNIEGLTFFSHQGQDYLLLVCDDGKDKKRGAHYLIIRRSDLGL